MRLLGAGTVAACSGVTCLQAMSRTILRTTVVTWCWRSSSASLRWSFSSFSSTCWAIYSASEHSPDDHRILERRRYDESVIHWLILTSALSASPPTERNSIHFSLYTYSDSDVISFHIYAGLFLSPSCGWNSQNCFLLWHHLNMLCWQANDHMDIFVNQRIAFYLNSTINRRPLTTYIMSCYTHKMAIVPWP